MKNREHKKKEAIAGYSFKLNMFEQFKKKPKINFKKAKPHILDALREKDYEKLKKWLEEYFPNQESRDSFFAQEGHSILKFIFAYSDDLSPFEFIPNSFSVASIQSALKNDNYDAIQEFFIVQSGAEMFGHDDESHRTIRIEKFKILLRYARDIMEEFMSENKDSSYMTMKITEDFSQAQREKLNKFNSTSKPIHA